MTVPWLSLIPYMISALVSLGISIFTFSRRRVPGAFIFAHLAFAEFLWTLGYMFQSMADTLTWKLVWNNLQFLGAVFTPTLFFWFGLAYSGHSGASSFRLRWLVNGASITLVLFIWTDGWLHSFFRTMPIVIPQRPFSRLIFLDGPAFWLYPVLGHTLFLIGIYLVARSTIIAPRVFRLQAFTVLFAVLIPWLTTIFTWLKMVPVTTHDITPLTFFVSNLMIAFALFRFGLFDLVPIAYRTLVEQMEDAILVIDSEQRIVEVNPVALRILSSRARLIEGQLLETIFPGSGQKWLEDSLLGQNVELTLPGEEGERVYEVHLTPLTNNQGGHSGSLILLRDVTRRKQTEQQLQQLAITDPLIGVFNRRHFYTLAETEIQQARQNQQPLALILFDLDNFKVINDTFGHLVGDQVLIGLVQFCQSHLRPSDILARFGGEEFIILLPETNEKQAVQVGERLCSVFANHLIQTEIGPVTVTASFGVAGFGPKDEISIDKLIDHSDRALYTAKRRGRNRVCLYETPVFHPR